jgi:hypothetical protein
VQRLATEFTWLSENSDAREATELEIKRLVNKHRRDMRDPKVRFSTMREAAANVAAAWDLDPGYEPDSTAARRFSGPGGKLGTVGGGGGDLDISWDEDKAAMAHALFPNDNPDAQKKKWLDSVGKSVVESMKQKR